MQAELIYNSYAGRTIVRRGVKAVAEYLRECGWEVSLHETSAPLEATALARQAAERGVDVVIAAGGDGTVNEVVNGVVHTEAALGVIPVGTTNVWAIQMRIPALNPVGPGSGFARWVASMEERMDQWLPFSYYRSVLLDAARVLVDGQLRRVDVGRANERYFLLWSGVGLDAAVSLNVTPEDKKSLGPLAYVGTALDTVKEYRSVEVSLTIDGYTRRICTPLVVASNIQLYGGIFPLGARACVDDGKLDVCVFKGEGIFTMVHHALKVVSRQHLEDPEIEYHQSNKVIVESEQPLPVHVDDEPFTETPVTICAVPGALKVIVPHDAPSYLFANGDDRR